MYVAVVLGGVSVATGVLATIGDCSVSVDIQCAMDGAGTALSFAGPIAGFAKTDGAIGEAVKVTVDLTSQFMALPFTLVGLVLSTR